MAGGLTGTHVNGEGGWIADANAQDDAINAATAAIAGKTTASAAADAAAILINLSEDRTAAAYQAKPTPVPSVTGARDTDAWRVSLLAALAAQGLITDQTTDTGAPGSAPVWYSSQVTAGTVGVAYSFTYVATGTPTPTYAVTVAPCRPD